MSQVRRHTRNPSPPPRQIPSLPNAIRFQPPLSRNTRRTQSFQTTNLPSYTGSPIRPTYQHPLSSSQTNLFYNQSNTRYHLLTGLFINPNPTTITNHNNYNENYEQSYVISPTYNQITPRDRPILPPAPPPSSENIYSFPQQQQFEQPQLNNNVTEESVAIPTLGDDDGLPAVSIDRNHLPIFARFPFDVTFIPRSMDTNVEDNIHKLRLRLIDSELNHQRRSTDDYIKRTHEQFSLLPSKSPEHYLHNVRPPTNLTYQRVTPKILSRQTSYSPLSIQSSRNGDRIGTENDTQNNYDIERELEIRRIQESLNSGRRSNQQLMISNYAYDPRLHLQPVQEERQYSSSNMDDLIDSMARRHLAIRRLDAAIDQQRRSNLGYVPYRESSTMSRRASLRNAPRNDDLFFTTTSTTTIVEPDFIRTRGDYYPRIQPDLNGLNTDSLMRMNSYSKLPPISPGIDTSRYIRSQNPSNSALYQAKHNPQEQRHYRQSVPLTLPENSEHLIELPSDIFLTSRAEAIDASPRQHHHHHHGQKTKPRPISKDKFDALTDSESDGENNSSKRQHKQKPDEHSENGHHGFFTDTTSQQLQQQKIKVRRNLFQKAAIGIYFLMILKHRSAKSRLNRPSQTLSATIHKIRLQEIMVALHRVYLEPDGPIYNALIQTITNLVELRDALNPSSKNHSDAIHVLGDALKNVFSRIVDFMPRDGVLGTAKTSAIAALIQDGNPFPDNYFWQCEKELLEFKKSKIINVTKQRAILLLIGVFIFRALITTLLMKPIKYRLMLGQLTNPQTASLKVLATIMFYVGRRAAKTIPQILKLPHEWELSLYSDADIEPIIQNSEIKSIITTCELSLRVWCEEYIRRIDESFGKEIRT